MKRAMVISLIVAIGLFLISDVYARWCGGDGMGYGTDANVENVEKFQKETLNLRDDIITKQMKLRNEYNKPVSDTNRIAAIRKEIIDIQTKIQTVAKKYGISGWGTMGGMMMDNMMDMCPMYGR